MEITKIMDYNFITLCLAVGMGILIITNRSFDKKSRQYFIAFILICFTLIFADMADYYMSEMTTLNNMRYLTSAAGYILRPASIAIIINILLRRRKFNIMIWIPIIVLAMIALTSYFTHIMFWFDAQNNFRRGELGYLSHFISAIYMVVLVVKTIQVHKNLDFGEVLIIFYIAFICTLTTVLESVLSIRFLLPGVMMVSCALYYIILNVQPYKKDALTGLLNRRSFYIDSAKWKNLSLAIVSIDLNGLKDINDTYGHHTGDSMLCIFADTVLRVAGKKFRLYRIGGDEFAAIGKEQSREDAMKFIEEARVALKKTDYMASFGCAMYGAGDDIDDVFNRADARMYRDKQRYKHRTTKRI